MVVDIAIVLTGFKFAIPVCDVIQWRKTASWPKVFARPPCSLLLGHLTPCVVKLSCALQSERRLGHHIELSWVRPKI